MPWPRGEAARPVRALRAGGDASVRGAGEEWAALTMARRARGIGGGGPVSRVKDLAGRLFALLVLAIRRATVLATTMESRGFGTDRPRTWARPSRFGAGDLVLVLGGAALATAAVGPRWLPAPGTRLRLTGPQLGGSARAA